MTQQEVHISSLIIHVQPEFMAEVKSKIAAFPEAEIYGDSEKGKIIVVLETANQKFVTDIIDRMNNFEHVLSTSLVFHQIEQFDSSCEDDL
jgi:nitrate reductase NapD